MQKLLRQYGALDSRNRLPFSAPMFFLSPRAIRDKILDDLDIEARSSVETWSQPTKSVRWVEVVETFLDLVIETSPVTMGMIHERIGPFVSHQLTCHERPQMFQPHRPRRLTGSAVVICKA